MAEYTLSLGGALQGPNGENLTTPWVYGRGRVVPWLGAWHFASNVAAHLQGREHSFELPRAAPDPEGDAAVAAIVTNAWEHRGEHGILWRGSTRPVAFKPLSTGLRVGSAALPRKVHGKAFRVLNYDVLVLLEHGHWPWGDYVEPAPDWD